MAKNKKGYQELKRYRMTSGNTDEFIINLKKYADEFTKLLKKRYYFILSNGQKISLKFEEGNFYHLLGFHKFTKTVFAQMISQDTYSYNATDFYKDVLNENIKFDWWDENKVTVPQNLLNAGYYRNFIDQKDDSEMKKIFNKENITSFYMEQQVSELRTRISQQTEEIDKIKDKIKIWNFKIRYLDNEHDQEAVLGLMDFGIDVEQEKLNKAEIIKASKQLHKELSAKSDLNKKHEKKVKKIQNAMSSIQQLDILMVQSVYIHFIKNSIFWSEAFWEYFVANFNWIESNIEPAVFKKIYKDWRLLGNK